MRRLLILATVAVTLAVGCSTGTLQVGLPTTSSTSTATPTPSPNVCELYFENAVSDNVYNFYSIYLPAVLWTNGQIGLFQGGGDPGVDAAEVQIAYLYDFTTNSAELSAYSTAGFFTLSNVSGLGSGGTFSFQQTDSLQFFDFSEPVQDGTGGVTSVTNGLMSPLQSLVASGSNNGIVLLSGTVTVNLHTATLTTSVTFGGPATDIPAANAIAGCYQQL